MCAESAEDRGGMALKNSSDGYTVPTKKNSSREVSRRVAERRRERTSAPIADEFHT